MILNPIFSIQFNLTPVMMGVMFVIEGGVYAFTAPFWGFVCDRKSQPKWVMLAGAFFIAAGFILIGPAPFIPLETSVAIYISFRTI